MNTNRLSNQPYDEALNIDDASEVSTPIPTSRSTRTHMDRGDTPPDISGDDDDQEEDRFVNDGRPRSPMLGSSDDGDGDVGETPLPGDDDESEIATPIRKIEVHMEGAYNPADYANLPVSADIKELFNYIGRFKPDVQSLETRLRPFIPDFIPAVGDIDAMIKVGRPDGKPTGLGTEVLDEPCAAQSDPTVFDLQLRAMTKMTTVKAVAVKRLENAADKPRAIESWISSITNLHRDKPPQNVQYTSRMPDIDSLMQEWPPAFEAALARLELPGADLNVSLKEYVSIVCALLDIPVHKSRVESLHLLFTLFVEFKNSQHFRSRAGGAEADEDGASAAATTSRS